VALGYVLWPPGKKDRQPPGTPQAVYPDPEGTLVNSRGMKLVPIQPGQFWMGSPKGEPGRNADETEHVILLTRPFYLGMHKVTVGQFKAFVKDTGYVTHAEKSGEGSYRLLPDGKWTLDPKISWRNPGFEQTDDHPVVCVNWLDAQAFCSWLTTKEGKKYGLPTEAQWEYCCRTGTRTRFSFGDDDNDLDGHGWFAANSSQTTQPVGRKKPNAWGLFDMHGNAWEWCSDWYGPDYYLQSPREDPRCPRGPGMVVRGGGWSQDAKDCRSASRSGRLSMTQSSTNVGFRVGTAPHYIITSPATGISLRLILGGKFLMGSPPGELGRNDRNEGQHPVAIGLPFWMGRHEVTVGQFRAFVNDTKYPTGAESSRQGSGRFLGVTGKWKMDPALSWRDPGFHQTEDHPVVCVSWNDAVKFCEWLSKKEGKHYALSTEAQWEYCCRAGSRTRFCSGNDDKTLDRVAWYIKNSEQTTHPVGQKAPNNWDLYDMHGNAWEWCSDWYAPAYGKTYLDPPGPTDGTGKVLRGGGWTNLASQCRSAPRVPHAPSQRNSNIGFRVVQLPEPVLSNTIGMKLKLMPVGTFTMGSNDPGRGRDEDPHEVAITRPFYMGVYKVTVGQFKAFVKETGFQTEAEQPGKGALGLFPGNQWRNDPKRSWRDPGFEQTDEHPVVGVTWNDANAFCAWLSKKEGRHYRLPTEAQWEYACRAGWGSRFYFGNDERLMDQHAWFGRNSGMKTHPVGLKKPNAWGLYDMYGNAAEMTNDRYGADYYRISPREDPPGPAEGTHYSRRGGGWYHAGPHCRSAHREARPFSLRIVDTGFRVVLLW
jgi:formylglycine-generating enzyme required for sulfatase activity